MKTTTLFHVLALAGVALSLGNLLAGRFLIALTVGVISYALTVIGDAEETRAARRGL